MLEVNILELQALPFCSLCIFSRQFNLQTGAIAPIRSFSLPNAIFAIAFSEQHSNMIAAVTGDGVFRLYDFNTPAETPLINVKMSGKELNSLSCNHFIPSLFLSAGVDRKIYLLDVVAQKVDLVSNNEHRASIAQVSWHPTKKSAFASCSADGKVLLFDLSAKGNKCQMAIQESRDILAFDFNKYNETLVTGSVDNSVKVYDLRQPSIPLFVLAGHKYGVKKVKFSPFSANIIASGSLLAY